MATTSSKAQRSALQQRGRRSGAGSMHLTWTREFWLPNSPTLNPLGYFAEGEVERVSHKHAHHSREDLKRTIWDTMGKGTEL